MHAKVVTKCCNGCIKLKLAYQLNAISLLDIKKQKGVHLFTFLDGQRGCPLGLLHLLLNKVLVHITFCAFV